MSKKNKWIIAISVFVVVVLAAVLLVVMLGDIQPQTGSGDSGTSQNEPGKVEDSADTKPDDSATDMTTDVPDNNSNAADATNTKPATTKPSTTKPQADVNVGVDTGDDEEEESDSGVIDFDDLLAAAGK